MENKRKKLSRYFIAFLAVAFVFLAIGLGSLGSFDSAGGSYLLHTSVKEGESLPSVIFEIKNPDYKDEEGKDIICTLAHVYVNVGILYSEEGEDVDIRLERGSSVSSFENLSSGYKDSAKLANITPAPVEGDKPSTAVTDALFNWTDPFGASLAERSYSNRSVSSRRFMKITAPSHNILLNEVIFVGERVTSNSAGAESMGEFYLLPAVVNSATPYVGQSAEDAKESAEVLLDSQKLPNMAQSSFNRFTTEEVYSLMTIAEMKNGGTYFEKAVYHGDTVYNSLGSSILAFGTTIFGMSQFGLRVFPMLASFGVLMLGFFLARDFFKSEKAGLVFAVLYALSNLALGLGHLGTPLMLGVFFFVGSFYACYRFFRFGMKEKHGALPVALSGLSGAAAVCVNGVFIIPMLAVIALFVAGMLRQQWARRYYLDLAIEEAEAEEARLPKVKEGEEQPVNEGKKKAQEVYAEYRRKNIVAPVAFGVSFLLGILFFSLIFLIPTYYVAVKLFDNPAAPHLNVFTLAWNFFAGGFVGTNASANAWFPAYTLFHGAGTTYAITALVMNVVAAVAGLAGIAYAIWRIVCVCKAEKEWYRKSEFWNIAVTLAGLVICLITAIFAKGALAFILLAYLFAFLLASGAVRHFTEAGGKLGENAKVVTVVGTVLLGFVFLLCAVFTFSIPLPASFIGIFG